MYGLGHEGTSAGTGTPDWLSIMSSTKISCSVVSPAGTGRPLRSHTFLNVDISNVFLRKRSNIYSILVGTLLSVLREYIPTQRGIPGGLVDIINGARSAPELITVATTRIPSFGDDIQNPVNGYRTLGALPSICVEKEIPSAAVLHLDQELLAVADSNNPITQDFAQTWEPFGVTIVTHFIIIFTDLASSHTSQNGSPYVSNRLISSSAPGSRRSSALPSPLIGSFTGWSLQGFAGVSASPSRTGSPSFSLAAGHQSPNGPAAPHEPNLASHFEGMTEAQLIPGTSIETACRWHCIAEDTLRAARYNTAEKDFLGMVLNHRKMLEVLVQLELQDRYGTVFIPTRAVTYVGGLHLSAGEVVGAYGWSVDSYKHKTLWFGWAEEVSSSQWQWKGSVPTDGMELQRYQCWRGIKYIWAQEGPLELGRFSEHVSESSDGQVALKLKQTHIDRHRTSIITRLEESVQIPDTTLNSS